MDGLAIGGATVGAGGMVLAALGMTTPELAQVLPGPPETFTGAGLLGVSMWMVVQSIAFRDARAEQRADHDLIKEMDGRIEGAVGRLESFEREMRNDYNGDREKYGAALKALVDGNTGIKSSLDALAAELRERGI